MRFAYNPIINNLDLIGITGPAGGGTPGDIPVFDSGGNLVDSGFGFPIPVPGGGTGDNSFTPYAVITGGTTSTGNLQNVSGLGTSGQVLTSNGAGALPTWQAGGGGGSITLTGNSGGAISPSGGNINTVGTGSITIAGAGSTLTTQLTGLTNHAVLVGAGTATITSVGPGGANTVLLGQAGADPTFGTVPNAALANSTITLSNGTNISVSGSPVSLGGTATINVAAPFDPTTLTAHGVLLGEGSSSISVTATGTSGQLLQSKGNAADPAYTTSTYPSTNATGDLIYGSGTNALSTLAKPTNYPGSRLIYNGTNAVWFDPTIHSFLEEDFVTQGTAGSTAFTPATNGTGASTSMNNSDSGHPGIITLATGSTNTGSALTVLGNTSSNCWFFVGGGTFTQLWIIKIPTLSNGTDTFSVKAGLMDSSNATVPSNGIYFSYDSTVSSGNWVMTARSGGVSTATDSTVAATTGWTYLGIQINAAGTTITYFINNVNVGTVSAHIPAGNLRTNISILKSAGSSSLTLQLDYYYHFLTLTSGR